MLITPNKYFDEIYVLSIPRRTDRWLDLRKRLIRENIYVKLFYGIDKEDPSEIKAYKFFTESKPKWEWSIGNRVIMKSFIKLFKHILEDTDLQTILVCEDDILFHNDFVNLFDSSINNIVDWKIWYLGYTRWDTTELKHIENNDYFSRPYNMTGNFAVAYKREVLRDVIGALEFSLDEGRLTADQTIRNFFHRSKFTIVSNPMLIGHNYGWSDTANREFDDTYWGRDDKIGRYVDKDIYI